MTASSWSRRVTAGALDVFGGAGAPSMDKYFEAPERIAF